MNKEELITKAQENEANDAELGKLFFRLWCLLLIGAIIITPILIIILKSYESMQ